MPYGFHPHFPEDCRRLLFRFKPHLFRDVGVVVDVQGDPKALLAWASHHRGANAPKTDGQDKPKIK